MITRPSKKLVFPKLNSQQVSRPTDYGFWIALRKYKKGKEEQTPAIEVEREEEWNVEGTSDSKLHFPIRLRDGLSRLCSI